MDAASPGPGRPILAWIAWWVVALGLLVAAGWLHQAAITHAWPYPYSDEAAHVSKTTELRDALAQTRDPARRVVLYLFSSDAYPNAVYVNALAQAPRSLADLRVASLVFLLGHLALALAFGPRLWGRAGTLVYVLLVGFSAYPLAASQTYGLDVPLVASVGAGILLLEASEGFRRPLPALLFVAVAAIGLYTKWTWALFAAVPCVLAALRAVGVNRRWVFRGLAAALLVGIVAAGAWLVRDAGEGGRWRTSDALGAVRLAAQVLGGWGVVEGIAAAVVAYRGAKGLWSWVPTVRAGLSFGLVGGLAGPWYALVWPRLWERYTHEQGAYSTRLVAPVQEMSRVLIDLVPGGPVWAVLGLVGVFVLRSGRLDLLARVAGAVLAGGLTLVWLPPDTRYVLPLLPMFAGLAVAGWAVLPTRLGAVGVLFAAVAVGVSGVAPVLGLPVLSSPDGIVLHGVNVARARVGGVPVPVWVATPPVVDAASVDALVGALDLACGERRRCRIHWADGPGLPMVTRAVVALARIPGIPADEERGTAADVQGGIWCGAGGPAETGWIGDTWTSAASGRDCRMWVAR